MAIDKAIGIQVTKAVPVEEEQDKGVEIEMNEDGSVEVTVDKVSARFWLNSPSNDGSTRSSC